MTNFFISLAVFLLTIKSLSALGELTGPLWWFLSVFMICLFVSSLYEIEIKRSFNAGLKNSKIITNALVYWIIPVIFGVIIHFFS